MISNFRDARYQLMRLAGIAADATFGFTLLARLLHYATEHLHTLAVKAYRAAGEAWWADVTRETFAELEAEKRGQQ